MKSSAAERTLPLFPGPTDEPLADIHKEFEQRLTVSRLERKLSDVTEKWYRDEAGYEDVLTAARLLHEAKERGR